MPRNTTAPAQPGSSLPRDLAIAVTVLTGYACLHPFQGWHSIGVGPLDFLGAPWPRYYTALDIVLNVLGFVPLGFAWATVARRRCSAQATVLLVWLLGTLVSLLVECAQNYLPTRVASNVDLGANAAGALLGAMAGARWGYIFEAGNALSSWRQRRVLPGRAGNLGLVLIALWGFSQLNPSTYLFTNGDLHLFLDVAPQVVLTGRGFASVEAALAAANTLALGLFAQCVLRRPAWLAVACTLAAGLAVKTLATSVFLAPSEPWHWATPGGLRGLGIGVALLALSWWLPARLRQSLASVALLVATALVNLAPDNPYWAASTHIVRQGHVLNFHGATQLMATLWPFLTLLWLGLVQPAPAQHGP